MLINESKSSVNKKSKIKFCGKRSRIQKKAVEEKVTKELKLILQVARIFGFAPISIHKAKWTLQKNGLIYSAMCLLLYIYVFTDRIVLYIHEEWEVKLKILYITIVSSSGLCSLADCIGCLWGNRKINNYLNYVRRFDISLKHRYDPSNKFVKWNWIIFTGILIFLFPIVAFTYVLDKKPILGTFGYFIFCVILMIGILKFLTFAMIIYVRFRLLNYKLIKGLFQQ